MAEIQIYLVLVVTCSNMYRLCFLEQAYPSIMTNPWQAPEVLLGQERPTIFADIWSVAATLLQWLTEQSNPWDMQDLSTRYKMRHNREMAALMKVRT